MRKRTARELLSEAWGHDTGLLIALALLAAAALALLGFRCSISTSFRSIPPALPGDQVAATSRHSARLADAAPSGDQAEASGRPATRLEGAAGDSSSLAAEPSASSSWPPLVPWSGEAYADTRERFLELGESLAGPLEETLEDLRNLPASFWDRWAMMAYVLEDQHQGTILEDALRGLEPEAEAARLWERDDVRTLWSLHQELFREQGIVQAALGGLSLPRDREPLELRLADLGARLEALRSAIWGACPDPAYRFLAELGAELRHDR